MKKNSIYFTGALFAALSFAVVSCKKNSIKSPTIDPMIKKVDYSKYDFDRIASASGSFILDTLWDSKKEKIIGFKLQKNAKDEFTYPIEGYETKPLICSFVSLKSLPEFSLENYLPESNTTVGRLLVTTYEPGFHLDNISVGSWKQMENIVRDRVIQLKQDQTGTRDFIFDFHDYENLKLLFSENVDVKKLFKIDEPNYPSLKNTGTLFYRERSTVSLRAVIGDREITDYFSTQRLTDENIARVHKVKYGKIAYMVLDASEKAQSLISKVYGSEGKGALTNQEIDFINESKAYFYLRGYKPSKLDKINQSTTTLDKILEFRKVSDEKTYDSTDFGIPMSFSLTRSSATADLFNATHYIRQINFTQ